jgi:cytochrome c biogenesis protein CcdA
MAAERQNWLVTAAGAAGVLFIVLGLLALALPTAQEGINVWQFDREHAVHLMDLAGTFVLGLGLALTWLSGKLWNHQLLA